MNEKTNVEKPRGVPVPARRQGPGYPHFVVLLLLVLAALGGTVYLYLSTGSELAALGEQLTARAAEGTAELGKVDKKLRARLNDLEVTLQESRRLLDSLNGELVKTRAEMAERKTVVDNRLDEMTRQADELAKTLDSRLADMSDKLQMARAELGQKQEELTTKVTALDNDAKYIISELGKKAEKAYMVFMERKLEKKITGVSEKVETVKEELAAEIASTRDQVIKLAGNVGDQIKKKVEEHVKIDFVPSASDQD